MRFMRKMRAEPISFAFFELSGLPALPMKEAYIDTITP